eukprot:TRINITY_DN2569_c0_g1_i3.p1 TRINITY_DN2569_c0_g1~~TRINITY_DN2569_c0_g1_i3.p1  ORF type:complete len:83 (-),score=12.42 TRINITY_DN2569_c0_g1_i3:75-323(-)
MQRLQKDEVAIQGGGNCCCKDDATAISDAEALCKSRVCVSLWADLNFAATLRSFWDLMTLFIIHSEHSHVVVSCCVCSILLF